MLKLIKNYNRQKRRKNIQKIFLFSLISGALGAVGGLFFSKKKNREEVAKKATDVGNKVKEKTQELYNEATNRVSGLREKANDFRQKAEKAINSFQQKHSKNNSKDIRIEELDEKINN